MLTDLAARDLLTAALARLVAPGTTAMLIGMQVTCKPNGGTMVVRDAEGQVLAHLPVPSFIRADADAALSTPDEPSRAPAMRG